MIPVLTVAEMAAVDAAAHRQGMLDTLVARAGRAVAVDALRMLGGSYGRKVTVIAGRGNNGADGRVAARLLAERGARVTVLDAASAPSVVAGCDLVIDAAYGTGLHGGYRAPSVPGGTRVLSVDIPSGVDGDSGAACPGAVRADGTVTFAAYKPGLLFGDGPERAGTVRVGDIGLDVSAARVHLLEDADVVLPERHRTAHKWSSAVAVLAGSRGMMGAARLVSGAAMRAGAGMVRLFSLGVEPGELPATEVVSRPLVGPTQVPDVLDVLSRCRCLVVGPGLPTDEDTRAALRTLVARSPVPVVIDASGLAAFDGPHALAQAVRGGSGRAVILTPHDGEFATLVGHPVGEDRLEEVRDLSHSSGAVVLLKGPTTVVASPEGSALLSLSGGPALATAGTGDVLSGIIGAFVARGLPAMEAAAFAAHAHGAAATLSALGTSGLVAGDLLHLVPVWLGERDHG